jgi:TetR/AcrR family transcriptional regulator, mexJK operon transcriptional repressor
MSTVLSPKRDAIVAAAKRLFLSHGYSGTSMEAIAEASPVSKPTLYNHFNGKQQLFAAVIAAQCEASLSTFSRIQIEGREPVTSLKAIARAFVDLLYSSDSLALYPLIIAEQRNLPAFGELIYKSGPDSFHEQLFSYLTELNAKGVLRIADAETASQLFLGMLQGHTHFRCLMGLQPGLSEADKEQLIDAAVALFQKGYGYAA